MKPTKIFAFLTLVGLIHSTSLVFATPNNYAPETKETEELKEKVDPRLKELSIADPPVVTNPEAVKKKVYFRYQKSMSPRLGLLFDPAIIRKDKKLLSVFGFHILFPRQKQPQWEAGVDLVTNSTGRIHLARKWTFDPNDALRPFLKAGAGCRLIGKEQLSSIARIDNYQVRFSLGMEDFISDPMSVRIELDTGLGIKYQEFVLALGYSWAW
jgi:hypothetical protein